MLLAVHSPLGHCLPACLPALVVCRRVPNDCSIDIPQNRYHHLSVALDMSVAKERTGAAEELNTDYIKDKTHSH